MGTNVILGIGNFSTIFRIRGLSSGELWDDLLLFVSVILFSLEKISIPAPAVVIITITVIEMSSIFQKLRGLGGFGDAGSRIGCGMF